MICQNYPFRVFHTFYKDYLEKNDSINDRNFHIKATHDCDIFLPDVVLRFIAKPDDTQGSRQHSPQTR